MDRDLDWSIEAQFPYFHPEFGWLHASRSRSNNLLSLWLPQRHRRFYRCQLCQLNHYDEVMNEFKKELSSLGSSSEDSLHPHNLDRDSTKLKSDIMEEDAEEGNLCQCQGHGHDQGSEVVVDSVSSSP